MPGVQLGMVVERRREIDSLRGLAALAVLFYHTLATNFSELNKGIQLTPVAGFWNNLLVYSPLHAVWLGDESVFLFFVLSGFVLARMAGRATFTWRAYYPSRLVRLYVPVWGAIVLAYGIYLFVPHHAAPQDVAALAGAAKSYPGSAVLKDMTLLAGTSPSLGTLWSLQWEVFFSLALPVYLYLAKSFPKSTTLLALLVCIRGWLRQDVATEFMPMFFLGVVVAQYWAPISRRFAFLGIDRVRAHIYGGLLFLLALCGLTSYFLLGPGLASAGWPPRPVTVVLILGGVVLLVILVQEWKPLRRLLSTRLFVFAGTISFSLYLVHLPIVVAVAFVVHRGWPATVLGIVLSLIVSYVFYRCVEKPAHGLSRRMSHSIRTRTRLSGSVQTSEEGAQQ